MNEYTASNGVTVRDYPSNSGAKAVRQEGHFDVPLGVDAVQALREFFQAEADERLDRWRWPYEGNRDMLAYPLRDTPNQARVLDESTGIAHVICRDEQPERFVTAHTSAAAAYFEAHPEPKPWRDAKPGEVWSITGPSIDREAPQAADGGAIALCFEDNSGRLVPTLYFVFGDGGASDNIEIDDKVITAGTRIYPPAEES